MAGNVVFTVGSVLRGDDAAGPMLAKLLENDPVDGWTVVDGGQMPEDMLAVVRRLEPEFLLLVDAASMGLEPGAVRVLDEDDVSVDFMMTTHSLPITFLLSELKACCSEILFLGIRLSHRDFFGALHPEVMAAVKDIEACVRSGGDFGRYRRLGA